MKDTLWMGGLIGLVFPLISYILTNYTELQTIFFKEKPIALYVIAATINLLLLRFTYKAGKQNLAKGILLSTFLAMLILLYGSGLKIG